MSHLILPAVIVIIIIVLITMICLAPVNNTIVSQPPIIPTSPARILRLVTQWYRDKSPARQQELDYVLKKNLSSPFDEIIVVVEPDVQDCPYRDNPKIRVVTNHRHRPTFGDLFTWAARDADENTVTAVCNSDIVFDGTAQLFRRLPQTHAIALTRWELPNFAGEETNYQLAKSLIHIGWHYDTWVVRGSIPDRLRALDFAPGTHSCDMVLNAVLQEMYIMFNPHETIFSYHVHTIDTRQEVNKVEVPGCKACVTSCRWVK